MYELLTFYIPISQDILNTNTNMSMNMGVKALEKQDGTHRIALAAGQQCVWLRDGSPSCTHAARLFSIVGSVLELSSLTSVGIRAVPKSLVY